MDFDLEVEWEELRECWCILGESERPLLYGAAFIWMLGVFSSQLSQGRKWIKFLDELFYRSSAVSLIAKIFISLEDLFSPLEAFT